MTKVSFDFDGTLSRDSVQLYAKELLKRNFKVWICTARFGLENAPSETWNDDLYEIADRIGIPRNQIQFCNMRDKYHFFQDKDFLWHLDDDAWEVGQINRLTKTKAINLSSSHPWKHKCERIIQKIT